MAKTKRYNIEEIPMLNLFLATDNHRRIRFSADIITMFRLRKEENGVYPRITFGYDRSDKVIAIKLAASPTDPRAANVDKRGYASASHFYRDAKLPMVPRRYSYTVTQDDWLIFAAE